MIRVTVELCPPGDVTRAKHMGTAVIWNDGSGTDSVGHYVGSLSKWGEPQTLWRAGRVQNFERHRGGVWDLLRAMLNGALRDRPQPRVSSERIAATELRKESLRRAGQGELVAAQGNLEELPRKDTTP